MEFEKYKLNENSGTKDPSYNSFSDQALWTKFCNGDQLAFASIYKRYVNDLYNYGYQTCQDKDLSKDIIQDVFIKLRFSKSSSKIRSIKSYLFKCFYTEWVKRSKALPKHSDLSDACAITLSYEEKMVASQQGEDRLKYVKEALDSLTAKQRNGIMLFFYEGMSYTEIAEAMALKNAKSARKLIYRALERLRPNEAVMKILYSFLL